MKDFEININKYIQNNLTDSEIMDWFLHFEQTEQREIIYNLSLLIRKAHPADDLLNNAIYRAKKYSNSELKESFIKLLSIFKTTSNSKRETKNKEIKKGCFQIVSLISLAILFLILISRISISRSDDKLERIAKAIYTSKKHDFKETNKWDDFVLLPYKDNEDHTALSFTWIYILETGDTAETTIEVSRKKRLLHDEKPLAIYYNSKHSYIFRTDKDLVNLLPEKYKHDSTYISKLSLSDKQDDFMDTKDSLKFIVSPKRLYDYLNKGFYSVLIRYDNYTSIAFYEPIADLIIDNNVKSTSTAMIIFDKNSNVLIKPYQATDSEWSNYNKE